MNHSRGWAIVVMCVSLLWGCSNQKAREQLVRDVERLVLEHERFVQDLDRYHQERERLEERTVGLLAGVFLSTWLPDGAAGLAGEAEQITEDAQQFAPEAERLYQEGERLAWELRRAYVRRDLLVPEGEQLTRERSRFAQELDLMYQTVDLIEQEVWQATRTYEQTIDNLEATKQEKERAEEQARQKARRAVARAQQRAQRAEDQAEQQAQQTIDDLDKVIERAEQERERVVQEVAQAGAEWRQALDEWKQRSRQEGIQVLEEMPPMQDLPGMKKWKRATQELEQVVGNLARARLERDQILFKAPQHFSWRADPEYGQAEDDLMRVLADMEQIEEAADQAKQIYEQSYNRLAQDLERAYLNWNWLAPYLDRLVRDMGLRVRLD